MIDIDAMALSSVLMKQARIEAGLELMNFSMGLLVIYFTFKLAKKAVNFIGVPLALFGCFMIWFCVHEFRGVVVKLVNPQYWVFEKLNEARRLSE